MIKKIFFLLTSLSFLNSNDISVDYCLRRIEPISHYENVDNKYSYKVELLYRNHSEGKAKLSFQGKITYIEKGAEQSFIIKTRVKTDKNKEGHLAIIVNKEERPICKNCKSEFVETCNYSDESGSHIYGLNIF